MSKDLNISRLCDVYGALLTENMRELIRDYYDGDLSLAEIAENRGITRQAALCGIRQGVNRLEDYERKLCVVANADRLKTDLSDLRSLLESDVEQANLKLGRIMAELPQ